MNTRLLRLAIFRGRGRREFNVAKGTWLIFSRSGRINTDEMRPIAASIR